MIDDGDASPGPPPSPPEPDPWDRPAYAAERLALALGGDATALSELVRALQPAVQQEIGWLLRERVGQARGRNVRQELQDLLQEVFYALFQDDAQALRAWRPEGGRSLRRFVRWFARHQALVILRPGPRNPWRLDPAEPSRLADHLLDEIDAERQYGSQELLEQLAERLRQTLDARRLRAFRLMFIEDLSPEDIGTQLDMTTQAVYALRHRLREHVRELVADLLGENREEK